MLNKNSAIPLYIQAREVLEERLAEGEYPEGSKIPSEKKLCEEFGISRMTLRQVITWMIRDGLLYSVQGKGTYVASPKISFNDFGGPCLSEQFERIEDDLGCINQVLEIGKYPCPHSVKKIMCAEDNELVYRIETLGVVDGKPLRVGVTYLPLAFCNGLSEVQIVEMVENNAFDEHKDIKPNAVEYTVEAVPATKEDAEALMVKQNHPLLLCSMNYINFNNRVSMHSTVMYLGEKVRLSFRRERDSLL